MSKIAYQLFDFPFSVWIKQYEDKTILEVNTSDGVCSYDFSESDIPEMPDILSKAFCQLHRKREDKNTLTKKVENVLGVRVTEEGIEELKKIFNE